MKLKQLYIFGAYLLSGFCFALMAPGEWGTEQFLGWGLGMLSLLAVDVISHAQGLDRGLKIADEILGDLCREKKIKVVPNAGN